MAFAIVITVNVTLALSINVIAVALPLLHVLQLLLRSQSPSRCHCLVVTPSITVLTIALQSHRPLPYITGTIALLLPLHRRIAITVFAAAIAVPIAATITAHFC